MQLIRKSFSQSDVNQIFGYIPLQTLHNLAAEDIVEWIAERNDKRGVNRIYNLGNLYQIAVATQLSLAGLSYANIKRLVMDEYLKGHDSEGNQKILNYMSKLLGIKIGETKWTYNPREPEEGLPIIDHLCEIIGIKKLKNKLSIDNLKDKLSRRRIPLYEILFDEQENINSLVKKLNEPFNPIFIKFRPILIDITQLHPISILIINLPQLASKLRSDIELML